MLSLFSTLGDNFKSSSNIRKGNSEQQLAEGTVLRDKRDTLVCLEHKRSSFKTQLVGQSSINEQGTTKNNDIGVIDKTATSNCEKLQSFSGRKQALGSKKSQDLECRGKQERISSFSLSSSSAHYSHSNNVPPTCSKSNSFLLQDTDSQQLQHQLEPQNPRFEQTKPGYKHNKKSFTATNDSNKYLTKQFSKQNKSLVGNKKVLEATFKEENLNYANKLARKGSYPDKTLTYNDSRVVSCSTINASTTTSTTTAISEYNNNNNNNNDQDKCNCCNIKSAPNLYNCLPDEAQDKVGCPWCDAKKSHSFANHSSLGKSSSGQNVCCNCCCGCPIPESMCPTQVSE